MTATRHSEREPNYRYAGWLAVLLFAAAFCVLEMALELKSAEVSNIASAVVGVAGTMFALVLPAAELLQHLVTRKIDYWVERIANYKDTDSSEIVEDAGIGLDELERVGEVTEPAWQGSVFVFIALFLSIGALFTPRITLGSSTVLLDYVLLSSSLSFLLIGTGLFFPAVRYVFRLDAIRAISTARELLEYVSQKPFGENQAEDEI